MPKKLLIPLFIFLSFYSFSQNERKILFGKIVSDSIPTKDVHIFNLNSRKGTISNRYGEFRIPIKKNDTLLISDIQYETQKIIIDGNHMNNLQLIINLKLSINKLNVVTIKEHDLSGNLKNDASNTVIKDEINETLKKPWKVDMRIVDDFDAIDKEKAPSSRKLTDPTEQAAQGNILGLLSGLGKEVSKIGRKKRIRKKEQKKYDLQLLNGGDQIRNDLGDNFFVDALKISSKNIDNFIKYCKPTGVIKKYIDGKKIEAIDILIEQSKFYLKDLKDEK